MDVTDSTFQTAVIDRSHTVPVVVDFWAEWCGPCRQLGPVIERAVAARAGKVELAKVDVDANPMVARTFRIQSIPAVKAFRDGTVVSEFVGAQPPAAVERFLDSLVPSEADALVAKGDEQSLRRAVELEPSPGRCGRATRADAARPRRAATRPSSWSRRCPGASPPTDSPPGSRSKARPRPTVSEPPGGIRRARRR